MIPLCFALGHQVTKNQRVFIKFRISSEWLVAFVEKILKFRVEIFIRNAMPKKLLLKKSSFMTRLSCTRNSSLQLSILRGNINWIF